MTEDLAAMIRALDRRVDRVEESLPVDILTHRDLERVEEKVADVSGYEACGACGILHRQRFCPMCDLRVAVRKIARQVGRQAVPNQDTRNDKASSSRPPEPIEGA